MSTAYLGKYYGVYIEPRLTLVLSATCNAINIPPPPLLKRCVHVITLETVNNFPYDTLMENPGEQCPLFFLVNTLILASFCNPELLHRTIFSFTWNSGFSPWIFQSSRINYSHEGTQREDGKKKKKRKYWKNIGEWRDDCDNQSNS